MKHLIWVLFLASAFAACRKSGPPGGQPGPQPQPQPQQPDIRPHGTPVGTAIKKTVGAAGGTIVATGGRITVDIPAGALAANTELTLQEVTNTLPGSPGKSFRLGPESIKFAKPITLTIPYTDALLADSIHPDALFLAYQDKAGGWRFMAKSRVDKANKVVKVETDHFSDWALYALFWLHADLDYLSIGKTTELQVLSMMNEPGRPIGEHPEIAITAAKALENPNNVKNWKVTGEAGGTLEPRGLKALFKAPETLQFDNIASVSVEIHDWVPPELRPGRSAPVLTLVQDITIDDGTYWLSTYNNVLSEGIPLRNNVMVHEGDLIINGIIDDVEPVDGYTLQVFGKGYSAGSHPYYSMDHDVENAGKVLGMKLPQNAATFYVECPPDGLKWIPSPGSVNITEVTTVFGRKYVRGTATGSVWREAGSCEAIRVGNFSIEFKVAIRYNFNDFGALQPMMAKMMTASMLRKRK
ncbi:hypothetical protein ACQKLP_19100 [Chitinophaga sp. NPDC101104]|uniref:hypothetical protein n=1 Tax=Chitinophaga sp. NPDC101104 TaxID=3390561 RepID=UPI003D06F29B